MKAMMLHSSSDIRSTPEPLVISETNRPNIDNSSVLIKVNACGVCHTELDIIEGRTPPPTYPLIPGHQVVGVVEKVGTNVSPDLLGTRVGVAWIHKTCGECSLCQSGQENLCEHFIATGRDVHGGYAEYMSAHADFVFPIPDTISSAHAAPLLCAGAIGYRSLMLAAISDGMSIGLTGFGASAHLVLQMITHLYPCCNTYVFSRNLNEQHFAKSLGAHWTGRSEDKPPELLDVIIDTTPVWKTMIDALEHLKPGGRLIINAIRKEEHDKNSLMELSYPRHIWMEKEIKSVANISRRDVSDFLQLAADINIQPKVELYSLADANRALYELRTGNIHGAKVLIMQ